MDRVRLLKVIERLSPLHTRLGKPAPGDWLNQHNEEGQTFKEYQRCCPTTPRGKRHVIYIQPLGEFANIKRNIISLTADFIGRFYSLPVSVLDAMPLSIVPATATRHLPGGTIQILTKYILEDILKPRLPIDAAAYIAFTTSDLWPGGDWDFVFGQASLKERVGVWSICRNGDAEQSEKSFRLCLLRTMKTAVHEMGHMFSLRHCIKYECCMCGSNNRAEGDRRPIWLCPECLAKVCWATKAEPITRFRNLVSFCSENGLNVEARFYERSIEALIVGDMTDLLAAG